MDYNTTNTAKQYYDVEVGTGQRGYEETMKIGLMYVSDYGYGASPENWTTALYSNNNSTNTDNNWMFRGLTEWTISRRSGHAYNTFGVYSTGYVLSYSVNSNFGVRPSFYLESSVVLESGDGTEQNPYRISAGA